MAEASVQPVPWVLSVATRGDANRSQPSALDKKIDALRSAAVTALDQHRAGAEREQLLRLRAHLALVVRRRYVEQRCGLGQIGCEHARAGYQASAAGRSRPRAKAFRPKLATMTGSSTTLRGR